MAVSFSKLRIGRLGRLLTGACVAVSALAIIATPAEARHWRHFYGHRHHVSAYRGRAVHHHAYYARRHYHARYFHTHAAYAPYSPPFSAMVVDANTGRTLYAVDENGLRHPASLTKVMTLYLLFEQLDQGRLTLNSPIEISAHAAAQAPTKLGLAPGMTISVDNAIKAIVTRSANDIAVAIAEKIGGSESGFAQMMTRKAHELGMSRTAYVNASGLPDDGQITTAHDLTILARAVQQRFPQDFHYFSLRSFAYGGQIIGNHDHLLGRIDGVDGIKTGFTRSSGFNLMTSVHRDGRSLVAVVMGGRSAAARDRTMAQLVDVQIARAQPGSRMAPLLAQASAPQPAVEHERARVAAPVPTARQIAADEAPSDDQDSVETAPAPIHAAIVEHALPAPTPPARFIRAASLDTPPVRPISTTADPAALGWVKGPDGASAPGAKFTTRVVSEHAEAERPEVSREARSEETRAPTHAGWMIQIAATDDAGKANELLTRARARNRSTLASATSFTEKVRKGDETLYRARFAGLDSATAEAACKTLKRTGFSCFATRD